MVASPLVRSSATGRRAINRLLSSSSCSSACPATSTSTSSAPNHSSLGPTARQLHTLPPTPEILQRGCAPFLSDRTVKQIAQTWQGGLLQLLNEQVRGTEYATASIVETVIGLSQNREKILAFNYASQALNNSFFLSSIAPQDRLRSPSPLPNVSAAISKSFGSYPELCLAFSSAAFGMSSSGWVWLVADRTRNLAVVPTFGAGTVIVQNRHQHGKKFLLPSINDEATGVSPSTSTSTDKGRAPDTLIPAGLGLTEKPGQELYPLLALSVHEHAWLEDYGIMGKEEYLTQFWNCVNWDKIEERYVEYFGEKRNALA